MAEPLGIWTVYDHPLDFPDGYAARLFLVGGGEPEPVATDSVIMAPDLERLREVMIMDLGLTSIPRSEHDDPCIVECWL